MITQIPIYRAKKIDSDEYVEGFYMRVKSIMRNATNGFIHVIEQSDTSVSDEYDIDVSTLAIHFPDMLDSEGNEIFASLSEDGKGGDTIFHKGDFCLESKNDLIAIYKNGSFRMTPPDFCTSFKLIEWVGFTTKITGIKQ